MNCSAEAVIDNGEGLRAAFHQTLLFQYLVKERNATILIRAAQSFSVIP